MKAGGHTGIITETAWAKINLALHVRRRMADGYHGLETIFAFAEDGDRLSIEPAERLSLTVSGPFASALGGEAADNLVLRAAKELRAAFGVTAGAALHLEKNLPVAAGLGGGSADAAAALRALARLWALPVDDRRLEEIAGGLGADVPACLHSATCRGEGRGDRLDPVAGDGLAQMPLLLVNPGVPLATAPVFAAWDGEDRGPLGAGDPLAAALAGRNDLEDPARELCPVIGDVLMLLARQPGVVLARMSGSGATCFALFGEIAARDAAAHRIAALRPNWWRFATRLR